MDSLKGLLHRNWRTIIASVSIVADAVVVCTSFFIAAQIEQHRFGHAALLYSHGHLLALSLVVFLGYLTSLGVYRTIPYSSFQRQAFQAGKGFVYSVATILSILLLLQNLFYARTLLIFFFFLFPFVYVVVWSLMRSGFRMLQRNGYGRWNTLAIGSEPYLNRLLKRIEDNPDLGYDIVNVITTPYSENGDGMLHVERSTVERIVEEKQISLIAFSSAQLNGSFDQLEGLCTTHRIAMRVVSPESDFLFSRAGLHDIAGIPLFTPERRRIEHLKRLAKRLFDLLGASLCLLLLSPIFLVVAIATKLESHGPIFFKQRRSLADNDSPFEFYKFRSMIHEADEKKESMYHQNESNGALFKMKNDPRLTSVGRFIRRYSIDELPQLFNVLKGEMSLVGPRPLPVKDFDRMQEEDHMGGYFRQRSSAKPGMTGLWQISGRSDIGFREMVLLDLYYIEHQTILFDIEILAQTVPVVLFGKGAY